MAMEGFISMFSYALGANLIFLILVVVACLVAKKKKTLAYVLYFVGLGLQLLSTLGRFKSLQYVKISYTYAMYSSVLKQMIVSTVVSVIIAIVGVIIVASAQSKASESASQPDMGQDGQM